MIDIELTIESGGGDEAMGHGDTLGFHGMIFGIDYFPNDWVVEVGNTPIGWIGFNVHSTDTILL